MQVGCDAPGAAADVGDRAVPLGADQFGEEREDAPLERFVGEGVAEQVGVADRHGVVGGPGVVEPSGNAHAVHDSADAANGFGLADAMIDLVPEHVVTFPELMITCTDWPRT